MNKLIARFVYLLFFCITLSCNEGTNTLQKEINKETSSTTVTTALETIRFECENTTKKDESIPSATLYAVFGVNDKLKIAKTYNCSTIDKKYYGVSQIPVNAQDAVSSYFAGGGDTFYAVIENGEGKIYRQYANQDAIDTFNTVLIAEYKNGELIIK